MSMRRGAWLALAAGLLLVGAGRVRAQDETPPPAPPPEEAPAAAKPAAAPAAKPKAKRKKAVKPRKKKAPTEKYKDSKYYAIIPAQPSTYRFGPDGKPVGAAAKGKKARKKGSSRVSEDDRVAAERLSGEAHIAFVKGDFATARDQWNRTLELDPENMEAKEGLDKIERAERGGP